MIVWKPKVLHYGWHDLEHYEALRQKLLAAQTTPAQAKRRGRPSRFTELAADSPAMALLRFLDTYQRKHGQMPSLVEIAREHFHASNPKTGYVSYCLSALESGGWIKREFGMARGIHITGAGRALLEIPKTTLSAK